MSDSTSVPSDDYEAPSIEARDPIGLPLIGAVASTAQSAAFRPELAQPYVAPSIVERTAIGGPLVAFGSPPPGV